LKKNHPRTIPAKFALIWFSGFRGENLNVIFYQNMPNLHNRYKSAERKLKKFLFLVTAAILNRGRSEQKVTTLDKDLAGTFLPSMVPIHPVVLEKKFVLHISHRVAMLNYVPRWWPSWIFNRSKK
jgi:hypothetical protein